MAMNITLEKWNCDVEQSSSASELKENNCKLKRSWCETLICNRELKYKTDLTKLQVLRNRDNNAIAGEAKGFCVLRAKLWGWESYTIVLR